MRTFKDTTYPKIHTLYKRDERGRIMLGDFSLPEFELLKDCGWIFSEKVDGTSIRLHYVGEDSRHDISMIAGRTDSAQIPPKLLAVLSDLMKTMPLDEVFPDAGPETPVVLYGEGYGAGIQKGGGNYISDGCSFVLFDVSVGLWWLDYPGVEDVSKQLDLSAVPLVWPEPRTIGEAEAAVMNNEIKSAWPGVPRPEGIVGRPAVQLFNRKGERITVKIKHKDYPL